MRRTSRRRSTHSDTPICVIVAIGKIVDRKARILWNSGASTRLNDTFSITTWSKSGKITHSAEEADGGLICGLKTRFTCYLNVLVKIPSRVLFYMAP